MKKIRFVFTFLFVGVLLAILGCVSSESSGRGAASGTVCDVNGRPISGAKIIAGGTSTVSDYYGNWLIESLPAESITLTASHKSYRTTSLTINIEKGGVTSGVMFSLSSNGDVYDVSINSSSPTSAVIVFYTVREAKARVDYGLNALLNQTARGSDKYLITHQFNILGLKPASTYRFRCAATDKNGVEMQSEIINFTTPPTKQPSTPSGLKIGKLANSKVISLSWGANLSPDNAGYNVYRALLQDGPFEAVASVSGELYLDSSVSAGEKYYYKVSAVSSLGVESALSEAASFVVPGAVTSGITWNAQKSPYILTGNLSVSAGASLTINKNVKVLVSGQNQWDNTSEPISIVVEGSLRVNASSSEPVSITSSSPAPKEGDFNGIIFGPQADLGASLIKGLSLSFAKTAVKGEAGLPLICDSAFSSCETGVMADANARENIEIKSSSFEACVVGLLVNDNNVRVKITDNLFKKCAKACICKGNSLAEIIGNRVKYAGPVGFEVGNKSSSSIFKSNIVGWGSSGTGLVITGSDEVRKNTLHSRVGIEIADSANTAVRSNLILADKKTGGKGLLYTGKIAYNPSTATNTLVIQNNAVFNLSKPDKYVNSDFTTLAAGGDVAFTETNTLELKGKDPFAGTLSETFDYTPVEGSILENAGFDGEDIGALDVPD